MWALPGVQKISSGEDERGKFGSTTFKCFVAMTSPLLLLSYHDILVVCRAIEMHSSFPERPMSPQRAGKASKLKHRINDQLLKEEEVYIK